MESLTFYPDFASYTPSDGVGRTVDTSSISSAQINVGIGVLGTLKSIACQFTLDLDEYREFLTFYEARVEDGNAFLCNVLLSENEYTMCYGKFIFGTMGLTSQSGETYIVAVTIECYPTIFYV